MEHWVERTTVLREREGQVGMFNKRETRGDLKVLDVGEGERKVSAMLTM